MSPDLSRQSRRSIMLRIGSVSLDAPFFQSPLSGYSDYAMRKLARRFGCPLTFTGVMLAKSATNPKVLAKQAFRPGDDEHPIGAQILGEDAKIMAKAAGDLVKIGYDIIDLNFACPAPKVLRRGRGGALLDKPDVAIEIFRRVRQAVDCPVTVKLRIGINSKSQSRDKFWQIVESICNNGADALTVHGRTVSGYFRGKADSSTLKELKQRFPDKIIIGSGDLMTADDVVKMLDDTGIDGVAIARGAIGNPWLFSELRAHFGGDAPPAKPTLQQQRQVIQQHFEDINRLYPPRKAVPYFRKFFTGYCRRHPERKKALMSLIAAKNPDELLAGLERWYGR